MGWLAPSLRAAPRPLIVRRPPVSRALRGQNAQYSIVHLAESGTAVSVETAEVDPLIQGLARVFRFSFKPLVWRQAREKHTQAVSNWMKKHERAGSTSAVSTKTAVPLSAKYTMEYCAFQPPLWGSGGGQGGIRLVTVEIARQHIKNFKGKLERFNNRIPLVACLLDIEKRPHCEI